MCDANLLHLSSVKSEIFISCLFSLLSEAEVLALQVKLDELNTKVLEKKDVGTQISKGAKIKLQSKYGKVFGINKIHQITDQFLSNPIGSKYSKGLMIKKCNKGKPRPVAKRNVKKSASAAHASETSKNSETQAAPICSNSIPCLPKLVPKSTKSKGKNFLQNI